MPRIFSSLSGIKSILSITLTFTDRGFYHVMIKRSYHQIHPIKAITTFFRHKNILIATGFRQFTPPEIIPFSFTNRSRRGKKISPVHPEVQSDDRITDISRLQPTIVYPRLRYVKTMFPISVPFTNSLPDRVPVNRMNSQKQSHQTITAILTLQQPIVKTGIRNPEAIACINFLFTYSSRNSIPIYRMNRQMQGHQTIATQYTV